MLASITPLGERARQSRWWVTVSAFLLGATAAGAALGALVGAAGTALGGGARWRLIALAAAAVLAVALDLASARVPGPRRQVNERWLDQYRGWVYGLGFGAQLGLGITTIVSSAATYVALFAAFLAGDAGRGALIAGVFGLVRGLTPLAAAHVRRPDQLLTLHRQLARLRAPGAAVTTVLIAGVSLSAIVGGLT
jgi:sulfite exporter TauE/SafE